MAANRLTDPTSLLRAPVNRDNYLVGVELMWKANNDCTRSSLVQNRMWSSTLQELNDLMHNVMVEIEPKWAKLDSSSIPQVLPHASQVSERRPGPMIHHFEAIAACFDNLVNITSS